MIRDTGQALRGLLTGTASLLLIVAQCGASSRGCTSGSGSPEMQDSDSSGSGSGSAVRDSGSAVDGGAFDSCTVVTQAEAAAAIGETVSAGVLGNATVEGGLACVFYGPSAISPRDPNVAQQDSVRVVVVEGPDALMWYENYKTMVKPEAISGYGDQAYWDGAASLSIMKGDYYVRIAIWPGGLGVLPSLPDEEKLATAILPSL